LLTESEKPSELLSGGFFLFTQKEIIRQKDISGNLRVSATIQ